ncbi:hypothetical protein PF007_g9317 [Phytophthora fragariae]|uniref:non-specific serine/threonine protein kinase n=1 Tax=Phytophthora fragariae TaxID=53985 RepID=A0A6A3SLN0_9STRA|nr:hypothetical protein PF007_g9317 [Phytophthora fragariae]
MESLTEEQRALFADGGQLDDYEVLKPIGKGKFSVVFKAKRRRDGQAVALKKIAIFDLMNLKAREKTLKEVRLVQSVSHSNIIQYLDAFVQNNELYIAFEWAEAGDLKRQIRKANEKGVRFDERTIWRYFTQLCGAILYLHQARIMHRDLKPANIFLTLKGVVKVGDLGLGRGEEYCIIPPAYPREPIEIVESCDVLDATDDEGQQNSSSDGFGESTTSLDTEDDGVFSRWVVVKEERQFSGDDKENAMIYTYIDPVAWELERRRMLPKLHAVLQDKLHHRPAESSWRVRLDQVQTHAGAIVAGQEDMRNEISQIQASRQQQTDQLKRYEKMLNNRFLRARRLYDEGTTRLSKAQSVMQCAQENVNHATVEVARLQAARSEQANALKAADARLTDNSKLLERKRQIRHLKNENRELGLKLQVLQDYWNRKQQHATQRRIRQSPQV